MWESLTLKFFHRWEAGVWDVEALGSESGGKLAVYRCLKDLPEVEPYARANLPPCKHMEGPGWTQGRVSSTAS